MEKIRLDRLLAETGEYSRSEVKKAISDGLVAVDGVVVRRPEEKVSRGSSVLLDGEPVDVSKWVYYLLNKPKDYICAARDEVYPSVLRLLPDSASRRGVSPAGRLDADVTGLVLITDNGDYIHRVISPKSNVAKVYTALTDKPVTEDIIAQFRAGTELRDGTVYRPAELRVLSGDGRYSEIRVTEGKFHEVKNLFAVRGLKVLELKRVSVGRLTLPDDLPVGQWRRLCEEEALKVFI